jgi:integrase
MTPGGGAAGSIGRDAGPWADDASVNWGVGQHRPLRSSHNPTGNRWDRSEPWRTLRRLARDAVPGKAGSIHPHDLRHAFVTLSLDAGIALHDVQDAPGHADPRTTQRYNRARFNLDRHPTYALAGLI